MLWSHLIYAAISWILLLPLLNLLLTFCYARELVCALLNLLSCDRLSYNKVAADCAGAIFYSLMKFALDSPHSSSSKFFEPSLNLSLFNFLVVRIYFAKICIAVIFMKSYYILSLISMCQIIAYGTMPLSINISFFLTTILKPYQNLLYL